jgi:hypothetical protein
VGFDLTTCNSTWATLPGTNNTFISKDIPRFSNSYTQLDLHTSERIETNWKLSCFGLDFIGFWQQTFRTDDSNMVWDKNPAHKKTIPESASVPRKQEENFGQLKNREPILWLLNLQPQRRIERFYIGEK